MNVKKEAEKFLANRAPIITECTAIPLVLAQIIQGFVYSEREFEKTLLRYTFFVGSNPHWIKEWIDLPILQRWISCISLCFPNYTADRMEVILHWDGTQTTCHRPRCYYRRPCSCGDPLTATTIMFGSIEGPHSERIP